MRTARDDGADAPGHDSFLDIVANMVGIMILLVMVVGLRASREASRPADPEVAEPVVAVEPVDEHLVSAAVHQASEAEHDVRKLVERTLSVRSETLLREKERNWLTTYVSAAGQELENQRRQLDVQQQRDFDLQRKLNEAQLDLDNLTRERVSLLTAETEVEELESLPTPLSKTVSGNELHLRLAEGHVAAIPLTELIAEVKGHFERNTWRLREKDKVVSTVGPVGGFRIRYLMQKGRMSVQSNQHVQTSGSFVRVAGWELLPSSARMGEPTEQALLPRSDLWYTLRSHSPDSTTVTIWTYPDSFSDFRRLKEALFEAGYATAGRPLEYGMPIAGSPQGSRSSAQ